MTELLLQWFDRARRILWRNEARFDALLNVLERIAEYNKAQTEKANEGR